MVDGHRTGLLREAKAVVQDVVDGQHSRLHGHLAQSAVDRCLIPSLVQG